MKIFPLLLAVGAAVLAAAAFSAQGHDNDQHHVSGSIQSVDQDSLIIQTRHGQSARFSLDRHTEYMWVVPSSLSKVNEGDYVGVTTARQNGHLIARNITIFPRRKKGKGGGRYPLGNGANNSPHGQSMMIGTVSGSSGSHETQPRAAMQIGTVSGTSSSGMAGNTNRRAAGGKTITLTYNGKHKKIDVPASARILGSSSASHAALKLGQNVFIMFKKDNGRRIATLVAVGKSGTSLPKE
jgi:Cu/Ag efflux protein CusF